MTVLRALFGVIVLIELLGTVTFLAAYLPRSNWRANAVGRHLATYGITLAALLLVTLISLILHGHYFLYGVEVAAHAAFIVAIWQRVVLVVRERRRSDNDG